MPSRSQSQQRLFGMIHAYQSGKLDKPPAKIQSVAEHISPQSAKDFASTKRKGLPARKKKSAMYELGKLAAEIIPPGTISTALADTVGRVGNTANLIGPIVGGLDSYRSPRKGDRPDNYQHTVDIFNKMEPEALSNTAVRLGAPDLVDDVLWKKERGESLPWHKQIGGRVWQNPRTSLLGKTLGTATEPLTWAYGTAFRAPHYNPWTDVAHEPWASEPVLEHELGHAVDINRAGGATPSKSMIGRQGKGLVRDLYTVLSRLPVANLYSESEANRHSANVLSGAKDQGEITPQEYEAKRKERWKRLPAGFGSYVGANLPIAGAAGPLVGAILGRTLGPRMYQDMRHAEHLAEQKKQRAGQGGNKSAAYELGRTAVKAAQLYIPLDPLIGDAGAGKVAKHSKKSFFERLGSQVAKLSNAGAASMAPGAQRAATQHASHGMQHGMTQAMGASPMVNAPGHTQSSSLPKSFQGGMAMGGIAGSVANAGASAAGMPTPGAMSASIPPPAPQPQQVAQQPPQPMSPNSARASSMMQRIVGGTQMMSQPQQQAPQQ